MVFQVFLCIFVTLSQPWIVGISGESSTNETFRWVPRGWKGLPLFCPNRCKDIWSTGTTTDGCCACKAKSILDYSDNFLSLNVSKEGYLEGNESPENMVLEHSYKYLPCFPNSIQTNLSQNRFLKVLNLSCLPNLCDFLGITRVNLSHNLILDIPNITCLRNLTHLDLSWNLLTYLPKHSLAGNRNLRYVNLSHNSISYIEPGALASMASHVIILRGNPLISVDVSDIVFERPFCFIDFSNNSLFTGTNIHSWKMNRSKTYGPGFVDFSHNQFTTMPNVRKFGFANLTDIGKLFYFGFDVRHNPLVCNCRIAKPVFLFEPYINIMKRDYFNVTCGSPPPFKGRSLPTIIKNKQIVDLICNYTSNPVCPGGCSCIEKPDNSSLERRNLKLVLYMNCTGSGLTRLPHILPESDEIEFYLRENPIGEITQEHYMERVTVLDLSFIPTFEMEALENLTHLKVFSIPRSQQLQGIPRVLSFLDPCVFLQRESFIMHCTCSHLWMYDWIQTKQADNCTQYSFYCIKENGEELLTKYFSYLECSDFGQNHNYFVLLSVSSTIVCALILFIFANIWKFEIKIILRSRRICTTSKKTLDEDCVVYISFDEKIEDLNSWLIRRLEPFLNRNDLTAFIPSRDLPLGCIRSEETSRQISVSRYYIVFMSDGYFDEDSFLTQNDWKCIWNSYLSDSRKELLVVNYDLMRKADVPSKTFKTVMRFGNVVDFASGEKRIFSKMMERFL